MLCVGVASVSLVLSLICFVDPSTGTDLSYEIDRYFDNPTLRNSYDINVESAYAIADVIEVKKNTATTTDAELLSQHQIKNHGRSNFYYKKNINNEIEKSGDISTAPGKSGEQTIISNSIIVTNPSDGDLKIIREGNVNQNSSGGEVNGVIIVNPGGGVISIIQRGNSVFHYKNK